MSTSLLYHAFGARTYDYLKTEYRSGAIHFHLQKKPKYRRCAACNSRSALVKDANAYSVRSLPIGRKIVFLVLHLFVLICKDCGAVLQESRDVADPRKSYTRALARYVLDLSKLTSMKAVADHLQLGWDLIKTIIKEDLQRRAKRRSWRKVRRIAIDEIAIRKGHKSMTVVMDLDTGEVLFTAEGRDHKCLEPFFRRLRRARAKLKAIAVDMSAAYQKAIEEYAPKGVVVVCDRYHVVSNMNKVIDKVRREEQNRLEGEGKKVIKGCRYLLLWAKEKLAKMAEKKERLDDLLAINETLHKVYLLKEDLRLFWSQDSKGEAEIFARGWLKEARAMKNKHVTTFAKTIEQNLERILAWYDHRITTGPLEGLNNKIKVLKRVAYGYRDAAFFGLRVLFIHESREVLTAT